MSRSCRCLMAIVVGFLMTLPVVLPSQAGQELVVSAAASLSNAFGDLGRAFEAANPGTKVIFNFAASGPLLQQIYQGAPVDVFASADQQTMDDAQEKALILAETRKNFATNELVLIVPRATTPPIKVVEDLAGSKVARIALGNHESVPAGRYAHEALVNLGLWEQIEDRSVYGNSVRQVLDYVSRGEVDAGFVFSTDAAMAGDRVRVVTTVGQHKPILYPIAIVGSTTNKELAQRFVDSVVGSEGQNILLQAGFGKP